MASSPAIGVRVLSLLQQPSALRSTFCTRHAVPPGEKHTVSAPVGTGARLGSPLAALAERGSHGHGLLTTHCEAKRLRSGKSRRGQGHVPRACVLQKWEVVSEWLMMKVSCLIFMLSIFL